jgi:hypothetical protein
MTWYACGGKERRTATRNLQIGLEAERKRHATHIPACPLAIQRSASATTSTPTTRAGVRQGLTPHLRHPTSTRWDSQRCFSDPTTY